jgi:hypothetical protein
MMYRLLVEETARRKMSEVVQNEDNDYTEIFREPSEGLEFVEFSAGNPRVEHITGLVHLYKQNSGSPRAATTSYAAALQVLMLQCINYKSVLTCTLASRGSHVAFISTLWPAGSKRYPVLLGHPSRHVSGAVLQLYRRLPVRN